MCCNFAKVWYNKVALVRRILVSLERTRQMLVASDGFFVFKGGCGKNPLNDTITAMSRLK